MLITARAMKTGLALIRPLLAAAAEKPVGTFVMGTVLGDMHDIGQSIVTIMLENAGFNVINLGTDVHPDRFIETAEAEQADLVGFSALLSTTVYYQKVTIEEFVKAGHREKVKILVGRRADHPGMGRRVRRRRLGPRRGAGGEARAEARGGAARGVGLRARMERGKRTAAVCEPWADVGLRCANPTYPLPATLGEGAGRVSRRRNPTLRFERLPPIGRLPGTRKGAR